MAAENEPAKLLLPYLQRADELQKHEPLVSYYCRLYAMERGLRIPANERTKTTNSLLASLMNQLEKDKKSLNLSPDDHLHLEGFALNVFAKADKQDRAGRADINTAKTFYAASIFFEILNQFGELASDLEQKQKYAVWKAADIRKALKEGRKPVPGPPGGETDLSADSDSSIGAHDMEPRHTVQNINPRPEPDTTPSPQFPDGLSRQSSYNNIPPSPQFPDGLSRQSSNNNIPPSPQFPDGLNRQPSNIIAPAPPTFPNPDYPTYTSDYPSHDYQSGHSPRNLDNPTYHQPHHTQSYPQEPQQFSHVQQNYPSHAMPTSFSYPNFQSYPSFSESSLPAAPSHHPSFYQGSDATYSQQSDPSPTNHASVPQYSSNGRVDNIPNVPATTQMYQYDSNYQVPPEKISEAQKAARFAVGALAFDEVPVAVEHLRKALELLTNSSAGH